MKAPDFLRSFFSGLKKNAVRKSKGHMDRRAYDSLESDQQEMIRNVMELPDTTVKEIMVPRTDAVFISVDASREELLRIITGTGHSRFPVYEDTTDNILGILHVKDVLRSLVQGDLVQGKETGVRSLLRKPFFVPVSKHIDELLRELRRRRVHLAVVVDEYGGVSGIACMEDILEEIIGDIQDEFDNEQEEIITLGEGIWLCDARINLEDLAEKTGIGLPVEDFDTLGGFVFDLFGKIPVRYEKIQYNSMDFIVQNMEGHKINSIKIIRRQEENA